jgi:thiamine biosynthesis lipoprotein
MAADRAPATTELRFRAMGSECHLIVVGGDPTAADTARSRIGMLEQRWSRFIPTSEVSALNRSQGVPLLVSADTQELVSRAIEAKGLTGGRFDATVLGALIRAGYDRPFEELPANPNGISDLFLGSMNVFGPTVVLAPGTGFDPGGIGKGLAADMVTAEMIAAGARGVCINLGGDVRVDGESPDGKGWPVAIEHPDVTEPLTTLGISAGAAATSTRLVRKWKSNGEDRHHLIDPSTGLPAATDLTLVSVVAACAWQAEVSAKACLLAGSHGWLELISGTGMEALAVAADGTVHSTPGLTRFTDFIPTHLTREGELQ